MICAVAPLCVCEHNLLGSRLLACTNACDARQAEWAHGSFQHQRRAGKAAKDGSDRPPSESEWVGRLTRSSKNVGRARGAARALAQLDTDVRI